MFPNHTTLEAAIYVAAGILSVGAVIWIALGAVSRHASLKHRAFLVRLRLVLGIVSLLSVIMPFLFFFVLGVPLLFVLFVIIVPMVVIQYFRSRRDAVFGLLIASFRHGIPLETTLSAFAGYLGWGGRWRVQCLSNRLQQGEPIAEALCATPGLIPRDAQPLLAVGVESGALTGSQSTALATIQSIIDAKQQLTTTRQLIAGKAFYLLGLMTFMLLIGAFIAWKIIPAYEWIHEDFGTTMPLMSQAVVNLNDQVKGLLPLAFLAVFGLFAYAVLRLAYGIPLDLPGIGRALRSLDKAAILEALSIGIECNRPLPETLAIVARTYPKMKFRRLLWQVHDRVAQGADWIDSLLASRIIRRADAALLRSAATAGNLPWAMRAVARSSRRVLAYRANIVLQIAFPIAVCVLACVVAFVVIGLFMPLLYWIWALT